MKFILLLDYTFKSTNELSSYIRYCKSNTQSAKLIISCNNCALSTDTENVDSAYFCVYEKKNKSEMLLHACHLASEEHAHLLYMNAPYEITDSHLQSLVKNFEDDTLFGMVTPRFSQIKTDLIYPLPQEHVSETELLTPRALAALPESWIAPEILTGCFIIRNSIVANPPAVENYANLQGILTEFLCKVRRRSFRMIIDNRTILASDVTYSTLYPQLAENDKESFEKNCMTTLPVPKRQESNSKVLKKKSFEVDDKDKYLNTHIMHRAEALCRAAFPPRHVKMKLCLDCRGMMAFFCGTSVCQLGFLKGFNELDASWEITVLAQSFALEAHNLKERFPNLTFATPPEDGFPRPEGEYAAIIHMNQPCYKVIVEELHDHGLIVACNILDTISWDMIYNCPPEVERVWNFVSKYNDCIFYNSKFSQNQFAHRFPCADDILHKATYHSFALGENIDSKFQDVEAEEYILIFGNNYEHKDTLLTAKRLNAMYPDMQIKCFGDHQEAMNNVTFYSSGHLDNDVIEEMCARAKVLVFPSWIEGFGLPVIKALAYGRPVVVRSMPLWQEIADHVTLPGTLMEFHDAPTLHKVMDAALQGEFCNVLEQGSAVKINPLNWKNCAQRILDTLENYLDTATCKKYLERDIVVQMFKS